MGVSRRDGRFISCELLRRRALAHQDWGEFIADVPEVKVVVNRGRLVKHA